MLMATPKRKKNIRPYAGGPWAKKVNAVEKKYDLTQAECAAKLGVSFATWVAWKGGYRKPSVMAQRIFKQVFPD
jgi:DNA-binding transcriptional regulator YiaG